MKNHNLNVAFYKSRSFIGVLSTSFKFIVEYFNLLFRLGMIVLLPMVIIQMICMFFFGGTISMQNGSTGFLIAAIVNGIVNVLGIISFISLLYALIQRFSESGGLPDYQIREIPGLILTNIKKVFISGLIITIILTLLILLLVFLFNFSVYTMIFTLPLLIFMLVPLMYIGYVFIIGKTSLVSAIKKSFNIGMHTWGISFGIIFITSFLVAVIQSIASLPWILAIVIDNLSTFSVSQGEMNTLPGYFPYLLSFLSGFGLLVSVFSMIVGFIPMAFQYANIETKLHDESQS